MLLLEKLWLIKQPFSRFSILKDLKKCFDTSFRDREAAIAKAHHDRQMQQALAQDSTEGIKAIVEQLNEIPPEPPHPSAPPPTSSPTDWATLKYSIKGDDS